MFLYLCIVLLIFGIGDYLGVLTKAKISSVFVVMFLFLILFITGIIPGDIINQAGLTQIGKWSIGFIVFHMGTMINLKQLLNEWKTVVTSVISMIVVIAAALIVSPVIGRDSALVSIPVLNGGIVATQIMTNAAMERGLTMAAAMGTIVYAVQKFFGTPFASFFGTKEASKILEEYRNNKKTVLKDSGTTGDQSKVTFYIKHKRYYGNFVNLAITSFFVYCSSVLQNVTGVSLSIWALLMGAILCQIGIVPPRILDEAKSSGLINMASFASIIPSLAKINISQLGSLSVQTLLLFTSTMIVLYLAFGVMPLWKIIGSKNLALGISVCQMLGFPATYLISNEIAVAVSQNEEEKQIVLSAITPKYVVSGLATVTSLSILMAGIFEKIL